MRCLSCGKSITNINVKCPSCHQTNYLLSNGRQQHIYLDDNLNAHIMFDKYNNQTTYYINQNYIPSLTYAGFIPYLKIKKISNFQ